MRPGHPTPLSHSNYCMSCCFVHLMVGLPLCGEELQDSILKFHFNLNLFFYIRVIMIAQCARSLSVKPCRSLFMDLLTKIQARQQYLILLYSVFHILLDKMHQYHFFSLHTWAFFVSFFCVKAHVWFLCLRPVLGCFSVSGWIEFVYSF